VKFDVELDLDKGASACNCSICTKLGGMRSFAKPSELRVRTGEQALATYVWGCEICRRHFCTKCGIHVFGDGHLEELGGDYVSINVLCLDDIDPSEIGVVHWDGRHDNWEAGPRSKPWPIHRLAASA
jgi:hypothetical protein